MKKRAGVRLKLSIWKTARKCLKNVHQPIEFEEAKIMWVSFHGLSPFDVTIFSGVYAERGVKQEVFCTFICCSQHHSKWVKHFTNSIEMNSICCICWCCYIFSDIFNWPIKVTHFLELYEKNFIIKRNRPKKFQWIKWK